ncbi:MAG: [FeFe] hydrogenase H-cluster radical SAM maturase HydE [Candidatus Micrarchaeota archaeon]
MCYAIPGKVIAVEGKIATIEYFGEHRKAQLVFDSASSGDYVYAQGGVVVGKVPEAEAIEILEHWKKQFFELKEVDERISSVQPSSGALSVIIDKAESGRILTRGEMRQILSTGGDALPQLYRAANHIRKSCLDNACCVHGIIEFSNNCMNNCLYCGISRGNDALIRYRMGKGEIMEAVDHAVEKLGFKALVLQSGEDAYYSDDLLVELVREIKGKHGILIFMSVGERSAECYWRLYKAGAYGALIRFETSSKRIYEQVRPGKKLENRLGLIRELKKMGFVLATGFLIGLPGQTDDDLINDVLLTKSLQPDMFSFGPFIPHPQTPLASSKKPALDDALKVIALSRLVDPHSKILVTTALETLGEGAKKAGLMAGGNSLMINTTPEKYRLCYDLYPGKTGEGGAVEKTIEETVRLLHSLGRAPTDLGL